MATRTTEILDSMAPEERDEFYLNEADYVGQVEALHMVEATPTKSRIEQLREIVTTRSMGEVDGQIVDLFSASTVVQIHDALRDQKNRDKLLGYPVPQMVSIAFKVAARTRGVS
jgi:hypothetical protein